MQKQDFLQEDFVLTEIKKIVSKLPGCFMTFEQIQRDHRLREDAGLDSLGMVDLMVAVEDNLQIYFDPLQMDLNEAFKTIGSITDFVTMLRSKK
jgi:acyl carrier protein